MSMIITHDAVSYEKLNYATVEAEKTFWVNVDNLQLSKNVQSLYGFNCSIRTLF